MPKYFVVVVVVVVAAAAAVRGEWAEKRKRNGSFLGWKQ